MVNSFHTKAQNKTNNNATCEGTFWLNGKQITLTSTRLSDYLPAFQAPFALALNGRFVSAIRYADIVLQPGDEVDIVSPIAGG